MRVGLLGLGVWGFCLARHIALNGHDLVAWTRDLDVLAALQRGEDHPHLGRSLQGLPISLTSELSDVLDAVDCIVESVTTSGIRPVFIHLKELGYDPRKIPLVLTSKGVEQETHETTPQIIEEIFGEGSSEKVAMLSGPSFAQEVSSGLPTAVVCGAKNLEMSQFVSNLFSNKTFRVYPNEDIIGVALGGALKNVIAIACGIADGLALGTGARAALVTRGLHEMVKLGQAMGAKRETFYGLSGMGDLYLTCSSSMSRNFRFGRLLGEGRSQAEAKQHIGMVVEGASTAISAFELGQKFNVSMPITAAVYDIIYQQAKAQEIVSRLMERDIKEERL